MGLFSIFFAGAATAGRDGTVWNKRKRFCLLLKSWILLWRSLICINGRSSRVALGSFTGRIVEPYDQGRE
jgi:hypothetical protein